MPISMLKYIKIHKSTPTCLDLNRSPSGSRSVPRLSYRIIKKTVNLKSWRSSPTHSTTRVTTYTCYTYCCHNTGIIFRIL